MKNTSSPYPATPSLLVVDDDRKLRYLLKQYLAKYGFTVSATQCATSARRLLQSMRFDLIIVDILMPGENGLDLARSLRETDGTPILILSALGDPAERVKGLELGVEDYMAKPFEPRELLIRIRKILSRASRRKSLGASLTIGSMQFDTLRGLLLSPSGQKRLSPNESKLLSTLAERVGTTVSREALSHLSGIADSPRAVDVVVARLRRKIETDPKSPRHILTYRGKGYALHL